MSGLGLGITAVASTAAITDSVGRIVTAARPGDTIHAFIPTAGNPPSAIPSVRWARDGVAIAGATGVSLVVPEGTGTLSWSGTDSAGAAIASARSVVIQPRGMPGIITLSVPPAMARIGTGLDAAGTAARISSGMPRASNDQPVTVTVTARLNGAPFGAAITADGDRVVGVVTYSAPGAPDLVVTLPAVTVEKIAPPATITVAAQPSFATLGTGLGEAQVIGRVDTGAPTASNGQPVTVTIAVNLNGRTFASSTTVEGDTVAGTVTYSASGAPDLVLAIGRVTVVRTVQPTTITVSVPPSFGALAAGLGEVQTIGRVNPGMSATGNGQPVTVAVAVTLNGGSFGGAITAGGDVVAGTVTYSAPGAPDVVAVLGGVTIAAAGGDPVPGDAADLALTEAPFDGYVFDVGQGDPATGFLTVSGRATPSTDVEVRGLATQGGADTGPVIVRADAAGAWTTRIPLARPSWADWYRAEARLPGDAGSAIRGTARIGCGHVILDLGQSEREYIYDRSAFYVQTPRTHLPAEGLTLVLDTNEDGVITTHTADPATFGAYNAGVPAGMLSAYSALEAARPGRKWMFCDAAHPGTSIFSMTNDDGSARSWLPFQTMLDLVRSGGSDFGVVVLNWVNSTAATLPDMLRNWAPIMFGQLASGGAWNIGDPNPESTFDTVTDYERIFWDIEAAPEERGRGVFARARTRLALLGPLPFNDSDNVQDLSYDNSLRVSRASREGMRAFAADSRVATFLQAYGPSAHIANFGGGIHPVPGSDWGTPQFGQTLVVPALRLAGMTIAEPQLAGAVVDTTGTIVTITVGSRQGGTMTTGRKLLSEAAPDPLPPQWQPVLGVEMIRNGVRRPIWNAAAVAADPGTFDPAWQGVVDYDADGNIAVTLATALKSSDVVEMRFLEGQATGILSESADAAANVWKDLPMEHVPGWADPLADWPFTGIAVRPQPPVGTLAVVTAGIGGATPDPTPDPVPATWNVSGGQGSITVTDRPDVTAPTATGGQGSITITG